jgi:flagella basal body P-ring formation protein FlgA
MPPAVRSGEVVQLRVTSGSLQISAEGVAAQDGEIGDVIRIVNPSSGRTLRGRVVGPRVVEVQHAS